MIEHVSLKYNTDITMTQMAEMCHLDPSYFSALFKKQVGISFKEFLICTRLTVAENILRNTNHSVTYVAGECGFNDSNYFSVMFKKQFGIPPTLYQKKIQGKC